jgi:glucose-6-phosphate isomerase
MQALHQGSEIIPAEIILIKEDETGLSKHHDMLLANGLAQAQALQCGKDSADTHRLFYGNRPSSMMVMDSLSPFALGQMVALYEHKVFVESILWHINPFDQWGVELGKTLAMPIQDALVTNAPAGCENHSTAGLIRYLRNF